MVGDSRLSRRRRSSSRSIDTRSPKSTSYLLVRRIAALRAPAVAVHELLLGTPGCSVRLGHAVDLLKRRAELRVEAIGVVAHDIEPAALLGSFEAERRDDDVAAGDERTQRVADVAASR